MPSPRIDLVIVAACVTTLAGCASTNRADDSATAAAIARDAVLDTDTAAPADSTPADDARKKAKFAKTERELAIAASRLTKARMEADHQAADSSESYRQAAAGRDVAAKKLANFNDRSAPLRIERAKLALQRAQDGFDESTEELQQLEMMYSEEELGDKTAEIVIARANRRLDRSRWGLEIEKQAMSNLEETIAIERTSLELALQEKQASIAAKQRATEAGDIAKRIGVMSAESEVARLESELATIDLEDE